ncbi:CRTAC1 family protein [Rubrivirga sp. IMCC45206]|uniref:CRTAC1 family protein n=1 Tax=Rubrivirga sp. IMCC45206 TaxID=3391614 RepID=UPI00398FCB23
MTARLALVLALTASAASAQGFVQATFDAGIGGISNTNGVAVADFDRDGDLDVYIVARPAYDPGDVRTWSRLFANNGDGTFRDVTLTSGLAARTAATVEDTRGFGFQYAAAWGDYDNDGWPDLFLGHVGPDQLFHNDGDGTFTEVTDTAGVSGADAGGGYISNTTVWFDHDHDGDLDLYIGGWWDYGPAADLRNRLYDNLGDGTFAERSAAAGLDEPNRTWAALPFDANADGLTDLYLTTDVDTLDGAGPNRLYVNNGDRTFREATAEFGLEDDNYGMGVALGDADGNGLLDVYLTNVATPSRDQRNPLFLQTAPGVFTDGAQAAGVDIAGWGWGTEFVDLENDGDNDLFVVTGLNTTSTDTNYLFRNDGGTPLAFARVDGAMGVDDSQAARGVAAFDYDGDGAQDLLVSNIERAPYLYRNTLDQGTWLDVELEGTASNRDGLGATVAAWADGRVHAGSHHGAQYLAANLIPVHLGLGTALRVDSLVVRWPSGQVDRVLDLPVRRRVKVVEGGGLANPTDTPARPASSLRAEVLGANPTAGDVRLAVDAPGPVRVEVVDVLGRVVFSESVAGSGRRVVRWRAPSAGLFVWRVRGASGVSAGRVVATGR